MGRTKKAAKPGVKAPAKESAKKPAADASAAKKGLLDDSDSGDSDGELRVNEGYAKRFQVHPRVSGRPRQIRELDGSGRSSACLSWAPLSTCSLLVAAQPRRLRRHRLTADAHHSLRPQHNKEREELHRLQAKHPHLAAKLARSRA